MIIYAPSFVGGKLRKRNKTRGEKYKKGKREENCGNNIQTGRKGKARTWAERKE
jgi:hypothetical protein